MLIISNVDGTVSDNRHRSQFVNDSAKYWELAEKDTANSVGIDLIKKVMTESTLLVFITSRPIYFCNSAGERINLYKKTKHWLHEVADLQAHEVSMRDDRDSDQGKVERIVQLVLEHIVHRKIVVIDNDVNILRKVKDRCPTVVTYLVSYEECRLYQKESEII